MKPKAIIFLDIDGTLIDSYHGPNVLDAKKQFQSFQEDGLVFGINSNRAIEDILPIVNKFGLKGTVIGENGAFSYDIQNSNISVYIRKTDQDEVLRVKKLLPKLIKDYFNSLNLECTWIDGDTVDLLTGDKKTDFKEETILVLNNIFRKYTASIHIKTIKDGSLISATEHIKNLEKHVVHKLKNYSVTIVGHPFYCNLLAYSPNISKRTGLEQLKHQFQQIPFYAIGDEICDYQMIDGLGEFLTIGNSLPEIKELATLTSELSFTAGVLDILKRRFYNPKLWDLRQKVT